MKLLQRLVLVSTFLVLGQGVVHATTTRFSVFTAFPSPLEHDFQFIHGSRTLFQLQWQVGTQIDYSYRPFEGSTRRIIDHLWTEHFFGGIGITDWFSTSIDWPLALLNHFQDPGPVVTPGFENDTDLADPRVEFKFQLLSRYKHIVGLGILPFIHIPLGNQAHFMGDNTLLGGGLVLFDVELTRRLVLALNTGAEFKEDVSLQNVQLSTVSFLLEGGLGLHATKQLDITAEIKSKTPFGNFMKEEAESPSEVLGGLRWRGDSGLGIAAGGATGLVYGAGAPRARAYLRLDYTRTTEAHRKKLEELEIAKYGLKAPPEVQWAIIELKDKCPSTPSDFNPEVHDAGCPKLYELNQIASLSLKCPSQPKDFDPTIHDAGCSKVYEMRKNLTNEEYATVYVLAASSLQQNCPADPSQFDPEKHDTACSKVFELREAASLVARCPQNSRDFNPEIHDPSCPKVYTLKKDYSKQDVQAIYVLSQSDADKDGILDIQDQCPKEYGTAAMFGCPEAKVVWKAGQILGTAAPITFSFNQWTLSTEMAKSLNEVAEILHNYPEIKIVRIEGHADSIGSKIKNKLVSERRAQAVKRFIEKCGVESFRLKAVGMGSSQPVASNKTVKGRAQNRRATVLLLELVE